jgi:hypothetical protein
MTDRTRTEAPLGICPRDDGIEGAGKRIVTRANADLARPKAPLGICFMANQIVASLTVSLALAL